MKYSNQNLGRTELSWSKVTWLYLAIVPSVLFFTHSVSIKWSIVSAVLTLLTVCFGHSVGLHRGIIHKAFKMNKYVRGTLLYLFVQTGLGITLEITGRIKLQRQRILCITILY